MLKLEYFVYNEDGVGNIVKYNVLNEGFVKEHLDPLKKDYKKRVKEGNKESVLKSIFAEDVKKALFYRYWGRAEYEVVITTWPPIVDKEEIKRLWEEEKDHAYRSSVNLHYGNKIDIYDQVMLNFNIFIDYLWENYVNYGRDK